jgi:hypothetical protein
MYNIKTLLYFSKKKIFRNTYYYLHNELKKNKLRQGCLGDLTNTHGGIYVIFN